MTILFVEGELAADTDKNATEDQQGGFWVSDIPWPADAPAATYGVPLRGNPWAIVADLDGYGAPWELLETDEADHYITVPANNALAESILQNAGCMSADSLPGSMHGGEAGVELGTEQKHERLGHGVAKTARRVIMLLVICAALFGGFMTIGILVAPLLAVIALPLAILVLSKGRAMS